MGFFGDLAKIVAPIASVIPGGQLIGAIAGGVGALDSASQAKNKANQVNNQIGSSSSALLDLVDPYYKPLLEAIISRTAGAGPSTPSLGTGPVGDPFGLKAGVENMNPYNEANERNLIAGTRAASARFFDDAARRTATDLGAGRGFKYSSAVPAAVAGVRSAQAGNIASAYNNFAQQGAEWRANALQNAEGDTWNRLLQSRSLDEGKGQQEISNLFAALNSLSALRGQGTGGLGGLQQLYNSQSAAANNNFSTALGSLAQSGIFDDLFNRNKRPTSAGDGRGGTNQIGSSVPKDWSIRK